MSALPLLLLVRSLKTLQLCRFPAVSETKTSKLMQKNKLALALNEHRDHDF